MMCALLSSIENIQDGAANARVKIDLLNQQAEICLESEDYEQARLLSQQARELSEMAGENKQPYLPGLAQSLSTLGHVSFNSTKYSEALSLLMKALSILDQIDLPACLMDILNGISWVYFCVGDYVNAQSYITRAIQVAEENQEWKRLCRSLTTYGAILSETNDIPGAIQILRRSRDIASLENYPKGESLAYNNLAMAFHDIDQIPEAEEAALMSLNIIQSLNLPISELYILDTVGLVYKKKGDLQLAAEYLQKAIAMAQLLPDSGLSLEPYLHLGEVLLESRDLILAEKSLLYAQQIAEKFEISRIIYLCNEKLAVYYEQRGEYQKALEYYRQFHTQKEKIYNQETMQRLANLISMHKVETAVKDAEILRLKNTFLTQQIEQEKLRHSELEFQATTDALTGLFNRRHFLTLSVFEFSNAQNMHKELALIMLDVDNFKVINDLYGHPVGDQVLVQIAAALNTSLRKEDLCCRYGGDEFMVLLPDQDVEGSMIIAKRLRQAVAEVRVTIGGHTIQLTISAGITAILSEDVSLDQMIDRADKALLKAKASGRNLAVSS